MILFQPTTLMHFLGCIVTAYHHYMTPLVFIHFISDCIFKNTSITQRKNTKFEIKILESESWKWKKKFNQIFEIPKLESWIVGILKLKM